MDGQGVMANEVAVMLYTTFPVQKQFHCWMHRLSFVALSLFLAALSGCIDYDSGYKDG